MQQPRALFPRLYVWEKELLLSAGAPPWPLGLSAPYPIPPQASPVLHGAKARELFEVLAEMGHIPVAHGFGNLVNLQRGIQEQLLGPVNAQAIEDIRSAAVLHDTVCETEDMCKEVKKILGI